MYDFSLDWQLLEPCQLLRAWICHSNWKTWSCQTYHKLSKTSNSDVRQQREHECYVKMVVSGRDILTNVLYLSPVDWLFGKPAYIILIHIFILQNLNEITINYIKIHLSYEIVFPDKSRVYLQLFSMNKFCIYCILLICIIVIIKLNFINILCHSIQQCFWFINKN